MLKTLDKSLNVAALLNFQIKMLKLHFISAKGNLKHKKIIKNMFWVFFNFKKVYVSEKCSI